MINLDRMIQRTCHIKVVPGRLLFTLETILYTYISNAMSLRHHLRDILHFDHHGVADVFSLAPHVFPTVKAEANSRLGNLTGAEWLSPSYVGKREARLCIIVTIIGGRDQVTLMLSVRAVYPD